MHPDRRISTEVDNESARKRIRRTWILWVLYGLIVAVVTYGDRGVFETYRTAAWNWVQGRDLYNGVGSSFIYFPTAALAFAPALLLPSDLGGVLWRWGNLGLFVYGVWTVCRVRCVEQTAVRFGFTTLVTMALGWSAARLGQMTMSVTGLVLLSWVALENRRHWRAAGCMAMALALKPLVLPFFFVLGVQKRALSRRLLSVSILLGALPFLFQDASYVAAQYGAVPGMLKLVAERAGNPNYGFADLFSMLRTWNIELGVAQQTILRLWAAAVVLFLVLHTNRSEARSPTEFGFALVATYTLLMSPATERNTYVLLAPAMGLALAGSYLRRDWMPLLFLTLLCAMGLASHELKHGFPGSPLCMLKPTLGLMFVAYLVNSRGLVSLVLRAYSRRQL